MVAYSDAGRDSEGVEELPRGYQAAVHPPGWHRRPFLLAEKVGVLFYSLEGI